MMGAKNATVKYSPEFMANLLTRLNSTVGKNPAILQPFLKYFSSYNPQLFDTSIAYPPYAMPRPIPMANDFLIPFSNYCRQPYLHQNDLAFRQVGLTQYQAANALPTHSLIEHIAQTAVQPINVATGQFVGQYPIPFQNMEHIVANQTAKATPVNTQPPSKAVSMVEKNAQKVLAAPTISAVSIPQPITIQDLIASLLEQPNNVLLQQQAQPFLQALVNQYHSSAVQLDPQSIYQPITYGAQGKEGIQINTEPIYYKISSKPTVSNVIEKSVAGASQSFKPYKKLENSTFQPIQIPNNNNVANNAILANIINNQDQKTVSMVQQQGQHQLQTPMPTAYSMYEPQGHMVQQAQNSHYFMNPSGQQMQTTYGQYPYGTHLALNAYDPNVQRLTNHFHGLNTY